MILTDHEVPSLFPLGLSMESMRRSPLQVNPPACRTPPARRGDRDSERAYRQRGDRGFCVSGLVLSLFGHISDVRASLADLERSWSRVDRDAAGTDANPPTGSDADPRA